MKQIIIILVVFSSLISLSPKRSYAENAQTLPVGDFAEMRKIKPSEVVDVVSPKTLLLLNGSIVQLSWIDVPDSDGDDIDPLAVTARDILKDLLTGQKVDIYQTKKKDEGRVNRMGHVLAHLESYDDKAWAQGALLRLGLARVKTSHVNADMGSQMLALEALARNERLGFWAEDGYGVLSTDEVEDAIGEFAIVEGQIESVALNKNRIYINFGKNWKSDFTVSISPQDKRRFSKAGLDPLGWGGQKVRVRGSVREYNGPYMEVTHPAAIEFIKE